MGEVGLNYCRSHSCADSNRVEYHYAKLRNRKRDSFWRVKVYNGVAVAREIQIFTVADNEEGNRRRRSTYKALEGIGYQRNMRNLLQSIRNRALIYYLSSILSPAYRKGSIASESIIVIQNADLPIACGIISMTGKASPQTSY